MGTLSTSSARAYAGNDAQSLRIAADARAALQHYPRARYLEQHKLTEKVIDSYSDLIFGTFSRADGLPRSIWTGLRDGAADVIADAENLAKTASRRHSTRREELRSLAEHISFAIKIGSEVRRPGESFEAQVALGTPRILESVWERTDGSRSSSEERIAQLQIVYRRELTVVSDWNLLRKKAVCVHCSAMLYDVRDTNEWLSPWYVARAEGKLNPVSVRGRSLGDEAARFDQIPDIEGLPVHPKPLQHAEVPPGMREAAIGNHRSILEETSTTTVCALTYRVKCHDGQERRVVLDGNHRLAAARRLVKMRAATNTEHAPVRVLEFSIAETERLDDLTEISDEFPGWSWRGFTPDVEAVRSAWAPRRESPDHRSRLSD